MLKHSIAAAAALAMGVAAPALAALPVGAMAPEFSAAGYQGGKPLTFNMAQALKKGPVVLYFFPAAHTAGCNIEAHLFADAIDKFHAQGATVIGVTAGNIDQLAAFSKETTHCAGKFPVAADPTLSIAKSYQATLAFGPKWSNRTSYVVAPDDRILLAYSDLKPDDHVARTLAAVTRWRAAHPR
ncbi:MAG TPA: peroxiredoxin [Caulobacteraceae bacterium]|nr:peroxiredoxin [Caulobacteraceae bacterium]